MQDCDPFRKSAIRYWEWRRVVYNLALVPPAFVGYGLSAGLLTHAEDLPKMGFNVVMRFLAVALGANVCYCFGYVLEFWFGSDAPDSYWSSLWRPLLMILGTLLSMFVAFCVGWNIATMEYSFR